MQIFSFNRQRTYHNLITLNDGALIDDDVLNGNRSDVFRFLGKRTQYSARFFSASLNVLPYTEP